MITSLYQTLFSSGGNELLLNFKAGYFTGVSLVLGLMLLWAAFRVLMLLRGSKKRVKEIIIPGASGDLIVSVAAITDLVKAILYEKFKHLNVDKVTVWKTSRGMEMELRGVYKLDGEHLPDISDAVREEIFKKLEENFGIRSVRKINCRV